MNIRFASIKDEEKIIHFINLHWNKDHVFLQRKDLLYFQHKEGNCSNNLHFVIAEKNNKLTGILGFIPSKKYSSNIKLNSIALDNIVKFIFKSDLLLTLF